MSILVDYDSGVKSSITSLGIRLMIPQRTLEPESMPEQRSSGNEGTELLRRLSITSKDATERTRTISEVHLTEESRERSSQAD